MDKIDIVIPWSRGLDVNRHRALDAVIERMTSFGSSRIILAEAGPDGTPERVVRGTFQVVVDTPWNKAVVMNQTVQHVCESEWIMMLDGDVLLDPGLRERFERSRSGLGSMMPFKRVHSLSEAETATFLDTGEIDGRSRRPNVGALGGGALLVRRDLYLFVRGFDERFAYMEDIDMGHRLRRLTQRDVTVAKHPKVWHFNSSHERPAYHLWHPLVDYPKARSRAMFERRRMLSANKLMLDTVSCIGVPR